jgi:glycerol kinase
MKKYILTLDQGTTSSRAILFNQNGKIVSLAQKEFKQIYPQPGWVEHDPMEIWSSQASVITEAILKEKIKPEEIAAIGITNAIVWQDRRTSAQCDLLKEKNLGELIREKTGLVLDAYFSATKIEWILDNVEGAREKAEQGKLAFGTVDSWLIWNLTEGQLHITDVSNASRTMLYNINTLSWDEELLDIFKIPKSMLPEVRSSSEVYGESSGQLLGTKVLIAGIAGDQQAALFGHICNKPGMVKNTYGTGCFMLMNIGDKPILSKNNLITTIAWKIGDKVEYAFEGSIFIAGAVVQWLRDELKIITSAAEIEELASEVKDSGGVYFVPAFAGMGAPYWNQYARGSMFGITRGTNRNHIARAALESIAFQTMEVLKAMESDSGITIAELRVDGGATQNNLLLQFQSDILNTTVVRPEVTEITAIGAAYLAGLAVGFWKNIDQLQQQWKINRSYQPSQDDKQDQIKSWYRAVEATRFWADAGKK